MSSHTSAADITARKNFIGQFANTTRNVWRLKDEFQKRLERSIGFWIDNGIDFENGGMIAFNDALGYPPQQLEWDMKLWWPQCETMIAARLAYSIYKDEKYKKLYEDVVSYCEKYFVGRKDGEWYGYLHYDNTVATTLKGNMFKGSFHIPRMYMIMTIMNETGAFTDFMK